MVLGATHVVKHREAPTAQAVTEFRQTLLTDVKAIIEIWIRRCWMICKKSSLRRANQAFIGQSSNT